MSFLQNRAVAVILAAVVVVGSTLLAGRANLARACAAQEEAFFTVSEGKAPVYYIDQLISASASLANLAEKYDYADNAAALRQARQELLRAEEARDIPGMYAACQDLYAAVRAFDNFSVSELTQDNLHDPGLFIDNVTVISGAASQLEKSGYNDAVTEFLQKTYHRFPSSLFARLFSIEAPALFA